jgi:hypothetical protein
MSALESETLAQRTLRSICGRLEFGQKVKKKAVRKFVAKKKSMQLFACS